MPDAAWWCKSPGLSGDMRKELLGLEPEFRLVFEKFAFRGDHCIGRREFNRLATEWSTGAGMKSRGASVDWGQVFEAVDLDKNDSVDWEGTNRLGLGGQGGRDHKWIRRLFQPSLCAIAVLSLCCRCAIAVPSLCHHCTIPGAEFWSFFSSVHMMGNTLQDYVTVKKQLKAWGVNVTHI